MEEILQQEKGGISCMPVSSMQRQNLLPAQLQQQQEALGAAAPGLPMAHPCSQLAQDDAEMDEQRPGPGGLAADGSPCGS